MCHFGRNTRVIGGKSAASGIPSARHTGCITQGMRHPIALSAFLATAASLTLLATPSASHACASAPTAIACDGNFLPADGTTIPANAQFVGTNSPSGVDSVALTDQGGRGVTVSRSEGTVGVFALRDALTPGSVYSASLGTSCGQTHSSSFKTGPAAERPTTAGDMKLLSREVQWSGAECIVRLDFSFTPDPKTAPWFALGSFSVASKDPAAYPDNPPTDTSFGPPAFERISRLAPCEETGRRPHGYSLNFTIFGEAPIHGAYLEVDHGVPNLAQLQQEHEQEMERELQGGPIGPVSDPVDDPVGPVAEADPKNDTLQYVDAGCSMGPRSTPAGAANFLALVGLVALALRRNRRV
jgi:MYXO-CTERM domain-containing protein